MDTTPVGIGEPHKKYLFKFLKVFIAVLTIFVAVEAINALKQYSYIGKGTVAVNVITVSGKGEILATPDIADFTFTVMEDAATAKQAQDAATAKSNAALADIKAAGVEDKDVKTLSYDLSPKYENTNIVCVRYPCPQPNPKIVGYTVTQTIEVKVRKIDDAGSLLTKITADGASNISGISFVVDDQDALVVQAREKAIADAKSQADTLAKQLGVHLSKIVNFQDNSSGPIYYAKAYAADSMGGGVATPPTPALPTGQNKITDNVSITYEID